MDLNIEIEAVRYHRNGVMGTGFYLVDFYVTEDGERSHLRAIQFADDDNWHRLTAVIDPQNVGNRYRGDEYGPAIREACEAASEDGSAHQDPPDLTDLFEWLAQQ